MYIDYKQVNVLHIKFRILFCKWALGTHAEVEFSKPMAVDRRVQQDRDQFSSHFFRGYFSSFSL